MTLGKVTGTVVSTMKIPDLRGQKLLLVQPLDAYGRPKGRTVIACDTVQAGVGGDTVMLIDEGNSSRQILGAPKAAVRTTIFAIVDEIRTGKDA